MKTTEAIVNTGDGMEFVIPVEDAIRTEEKGDTAV